MECNKIVLTLVTVTYNAQHEITKTIKSVLSQDIPIGAKVEFIFQDGKSNDDTINIIESYRKKLEEKGIDINIISEIDNGIYDAMNRGIDRASGKWVCLLNAGDAFTNSTVVMDLWDYFVNSKAEVLYCDYNRVNNNFTVKTQIPDLSVLRKTMIFCHQALFIRKCIYESESYDCKYKLVADYDLMLRLYLQGKRFEHIPIYAIDYDVDGISAKNMTNTYKEIFQVRKDNKVLKGIFMENSRYLLGVIKRKILVTIPQSFRWKIYRMLNSRKIISAIEDDYYDESK